MLRLAALFYLGMALLALAINYLRGASLVPLAWTPRLFPALVAAALMTAATLLVSIYGSRRGWAWIRDLEAIFRKTLGPLELREVLVLAFASGVAEELFFRGALQPALAHATGSDAFGLLLTTTAFALVHTGPDRALRAWVPFAFVIGFFLGAVTLASGNILPAVACHVTVNAVNLRRIARPIER